MRPLVAAFGLVLCAGTGFTQATWTGAAGTSWNNPGNWSTGLVPDGATSVVIAPAGSQPSSFTASPACLNLDIQPGASLTLASGFSLTVNGSLTVGGTLDVSSAVNTVTVVGNWTNNGTFSNGGGSVVLSGTGTLGGTSTTTFQNLTVSAGTRTATAAFAAAGNVTVAGGATLDLGAFTHTVAGNWTSDAASATVSGTGTLEFNGSGSTTTGTNSIPNLAVSAGTRSMGTALVSGSLTVSGGTFALVPNATVTVSGSANFSGGTFAGSGTIGSTQILDVVGNCTMGATASPTLAASTRIQCAGNWTATAAFDPPNGIVVLDGAAPATASGVLKFAQLWIQDGTKTLLAAADVGQHVTVFAGATFDTGGLTHTVAGNWTSTAAGAAIAGGGTIHFDGTGTTSGGASPLPSVVVSTGLRFLAPTTIGGSLSVTGGTFQLLPDATVQVTGSATFSAGTFTASTGPSGQVLDVDGALTMGAIVGAIPSNTTIRCGGNWSSTASFDPTAGVVRLDGGSAASVSGTLNFFDVVVDSGTKTLGANALVKNDLTLSAGASLNLGTFTLTVRRNWTSNAAGAAATGSGLVLFDATGTTTTGANVMPAVSSTAGIRSFETSLIAGNLSVTGGTLRLLAGATVSVNGSATFSGATFDAPSGGPQILDVSGNVTMNATLGAVDPTTQIHCGGSWSSTAAFAPTVGLVRLDGAGAFTLSGTLQFFNLVVADGTRTMNAAMSVGGQVTILAGASLDLGAFTHTVAGNWSSFAAGASTPGAGTIVFSATGTTNTGTNPIPSVNVTGGTRTFSSTTIAGNLNGMAGTLRLGPGANVVVNGAASLTGGTVDAPTGGPTPQILDVNGAVTMNVPFGPVASNTEIHCAGNWSSSAAFDPTAGTVRLDTASLSGASGNLVFYNLVVAQGVKTLSGPMLVKNDLTVLGPATLNLGAFTHTVTGSWSSFTAGAATPGSGLVLFPMTGSITTGTNPMPAVEITGGVRSFGSSTIAGNLTLTAGTMRLAAAANVVVNGAASLNGGILDAPTAGASPQSLDVNGDASVAATLGTIASNTEIQCSGNWSATGAFDPISGTVRLDGAGSGTASGNLTFYNLVVASGTKTMSGAILVKNDFTALGGATVNLGAFTHTVRRNWTSSAAGANTLGTGKIVHDLTGTTASGVNPMPAVEITGGVRSIGSSFVSGNLTLTGGTLRIAPAATVIVNGAANLSGGTFDAPTAGASPQILDVNGSVTWAAVLGAVASNTEVQCSGAWNATGAFDPITGTVRLDGAGAASASGNLVFHNLVVAQGSKTFSGALFVKNDFTVLGGATANLGSFTHTVRRSWTSNAAGAATAGTGLIQFDLDGTTSTGSNPMPSVSLAGGIRTFASSTVTGNLTVTGGTLRLAPAAVVAVSGNAALTSGTFDAPTAGPTAAILDVNGNVDVTAAAGVIASTTVLRCAGNWSSTAAFDPAAGTVELDGGGTTLVSGVGPAFELRLNNLVVKNGVRRAATNLLLDLASLAIDPGATFDLDGRVVRVKGAAVAVSGLLEVDAGSQLRLDAATSLNVASAGTLRVVGTLASPSTVSGEAGGGYSLVVNGTLQALHYVFEQMGPGGIQVSSSAILAPAPNDLRAGVFRQGSSAMGSALLHIQRGATTQIRYASFENAGTATFNVRTPGGSPITFVNWGGNFGGSAFEDDPLGLINWPPPQVTQVASFVGIEGDGVVTLLFQTTSEVDVQTFRVGRSTSAGGPFLAIANSPVLPLGGPSSGVTYKVVDPGLVNGTKYFYRLEQELTHGPIQLLASASASPRPPIFGKLVQVGPGAFPNVQSAINAAVPGDIVLVATGTYPSFSVTKALRIRSDGTGPIAIDTSGGPIVVAGIPPLPGGVVVLEDLQVGSTGTTSDGIVCLANAGLVVLDSLTVGAATGFDAVRIDGSAQTAVQTCSLAGDVGLRVRNSSTTYLSLGSVDDLAVESNSKVIRAGVTPGTSLVSPGSTVTALAGVMPTISFAKNVEPGSMTALTVTGVPAAPYGLRLAAQNGWLDLSLVLNIDMIFLLDLAGSVPFAGGTLNGMGTASVNIPIPTSALLVGYPFSIQGVELLFAAPFGRLTNLRDLVIVP